MINIKSVIVIFNCKNFIAFIIIAFKEGRIKRLIKRFNQILIFFYINIIVFVKFRENEIFNDRDYFFKFKIFMNLNSKNEFFVQIIDFNINFVQIKNIFNKVFVIFKNFRINTF